MIIILSIVFIIFITIIININYHYYYYFQSKDNKFYFILDMFRDHNSNCQRSWILNSTSTLYYTIFSLSQTFKLLYTVF